MNLILRYRVISELDILFRSVSFLFAPNEQNEVATAFSEQKLIQLTRKHGLVDPVLNYCLHYFSERPSLIDQLKLIATKQSLRVAKSDKVLAELADELEREGLQYALLKGPAITRQLYPAQAPSWRTYADLDILVEAINLPSVIEILEKHSFQSTSYKDPNRISHFVALNSHLVRERSMEFVSSDRSQTIDLHWRAADSFVWPMPTDKLLVNLEKVVISGRQVFTLAFDAHFLLVCMHGYLDHFFRLKHLADVYLAMHHPKFDEVSILRLAKELGTIEQVTDAMSAAKFFFLEKWTSEDLERQSTYIRDMQIKLVEHGGFPYRLQSKQRAWSHKEKFGYIRHQMRTRSKNVGVFAPLIHRLKLNLRSLDNGRQMNIERPYIALFADWFRRLFS